MLESPDPGLVGTTGTLVDETFNTLVLRGDDGRDRTVAKAHAVFAVDTGSRTVRVEGDRIRFRPEDRIKKVR